MIQILMELSQDELRQVTLVATSKGQSVPEFIRDQTITAAQDADPEAEKDALDALRGFLAARIQKRRPSRFSTPRWMRSCGKAVPDGDRDPTGLRLTKSAREDLLAIRSYTADRWGETQAARYPAPQVEAGVRPGEAVMRGNRSLAGRPADPAPSTGRGSGPSRPSTAASI